MAISKRDIVGHLFDYCREKDLRVKQIEIEQLLTAALDLIGDLLADGQAIQIRDCFTLSTRVTPARKVVSGLNGLPFDVPAQRKITVRALGSWETKIQRAPVDLPESCTQTRFPSTQGNFTPDPCPTPQPPDPIRVAAFLASL